MVNIVIVTLVVLMQASCDEMTGRCGCLVRPKFSPRNQHPAIRCREMCNLVSIKFISWRVHEPAAKILADGPGQQSRFDDASKSPLRGRFHWSCFILEGLSVAHLHIRCVIDAKLDLGCGIMNRRLGCHVQPRVACHDTDVACITPHE
jgi:hypothetical protein